MRWIWRSVIVTGVLLGIYLASAIVSLNGLIKAARAGDAVAILERTDVVRLRHSLVDQVVAVYLIRTGQNRQVKPLERLLANTYGATVADALISKLLTAESLTGILQKGSMTTDAGGVQLAALGEIDTSRIFELLGRFTLVKPVEFSIKIGNDDKSAAISLHFEGNGWKLSGINLSNRSLEILAQNLPYTRGIIKG